MDVIFETPGGIFSIEVGFFDTVLEIKEKVLKYLGVPITRQILIFNGQILQDDKDVEFCEILQNSRIHVLIAPHDIKIEPPPPKNIQLNIKIPFSKSFFPLEMDMDDSIFALKQKIHEMMVRVPVNRLVIQYSGVELLDHVSLRDYELKDNAEIVVFIKPPLPTGSGTGSTGATGSGSRKGLIVRVLPRDGTKKIYVEVNPLDNVEVLRTELEKLQPGLQFHLPEEGYFFIHKQNVMDEDQSFRWNQVEQGDIIEIFPGYVTSG